MILLLVTLSFSLTTQATIHNFLELGALPNDLSDVAAWHNGRLLNDTLAALKPGLSSQSLSLERKPFQGTLCCCPTWPSTWWEASLRRTSSRSSCRFFQSGVYSKYCDPSHLHAQYFFMFRLMAPWSFLTTWTIGREWKTVTTLFLFFFFFFTFWAQILLLSGRLWPLFLHLFCKNWKTVTTFLFVTLF